MRITKEMISNYALSLIICWVNKIAIHFPIFKKKSYEKDSSQNMQQAIMFAVFYN